ncbi:hypothetical protein QJS10_CPB12g01666 [Acorus calamus]|uniref:Uncharacterized protein n=1 Tax=Acorus calamus TaxID=4465 RepID=A0AAV9DMN0_ACOCL|nr:hypothetical protein QJS10_CPB12g01666 [Acorus calamus]
MRPTHRGRLRRRRSSRHWGCRWCIGGGGGDTLYGLWGHVWVVVVVVVHGSFEREVEVGGGAFETEEGGVVGAGGGFRGRVGAEPDSCLLVWGPDLRDP